MNECNGKRGRAMSSSMRGTQKRKLISDKWRSGFEIMVLSAPAIMLFLGFVIFPVFMEFIRSPVNFSEVMYFTR